MGGAMQALVMVFFLPLVLLNLLGGIGSGIWLAVLGEWWAIVYGIVSMLVAAFGLGLVLMPGLLFGVPAMALIEKGKTLLAIPFFILSQIYTYFVIIAWAVFVFYIFTSRATQETFWPLLIWSYGVALGPLMFLASKDDPGVRTASSMTTFFAQIAYVALMVVMIFFGRLDTWDAALIFGGIMGVGMIIQSITLLSEELAPRDLPW